MGIEVGTVELLLLVATVVAVLARRLRLPYTVGLVITGAVITANGYKPEIAVTKDLIFSLFLPPLVFEAALVIHWKELKSQLSPLLVLATLGLLISVAVVAGGMTYLAGWAPVSALVFAVLISATDPVSVIALMKEQKVHGRVRLLVESESLFNDGTAAALFAVATAGISGHMPSPGEGLVEFVRIAGGGLAVGALVGAVCLALSGRTQDHMVEIAVTNVGAFGSFLVAEHFHLSGVLATVVVGLMLGNLGSLGALTAQGRDDAETFWEFAGFVANSLIFLLLGSQLVLQDYRGVAGPAAIAIVLVLIGRAIGVYGVSACFGRSKLRIGRSLQHVMVWGGLRGALALALALGLPAATPLRKELIAVTFVVVAFSVLVQGMTVKPLLIRAAKEEASSHPPG